MQSEPITAVVVKDTPLAPSMFDMAPRAMVAYATEVANVLSDVIEKQKLYSNIGGKKHVMVEGWNTMGCFLGILPKERDVRRMENGSYEAFVDLVNARTGAIVGGASHICSIDEARWGKADEYARRSMSVTRATGKAYRLGYSWVMKLAGYEPTPFEEMPEPEAQPSPVRTKTTTMGKAGAGSVYDNNNTAHQNIVVEKIKATVDEIYWPEIGAALHGKPFTELKRVADEVMAASRTGQP